MPVIPVYSFSGTPNSEPRLVKIFSKTDVNSYVSICFYKRLNTVRTAPFVQRLRRNVRNSFSSVKIMVNSAFLVSLDEFTVSVCT